MQRVVIIVQTWKEFSVSHERLDPRNGHVGETVVPMWFVLEAFSKEVLIPLIAADSRDVKPNARDQKQRT